jgi:hypothetical protein
VELQKQFELSKALYDARLKLEPISEALNGISTQLDAAKKRGPNAPLASQIDALSAKLGELAGAANRRPGAQLSLGVIKKLATVFDRRHRTSKRQRARCWRIHDLSSPVGKR